MTDDEARTLKDGSYVMHIHSTPSCRPLRCTEVRTTHTGRVMIRVSALHNAWLPATEYALPREGWRADAGGGYWYTRALDVRGEKSDVAVSDEEARARWREQFP